MWATIFSISIAQSIFLIFLILVRKSQNRIASRLIITLLVIMAVTSFGYFVIRSELLHFVPQFFAVPFGMIFLIGPIFYFYTRSVIEPAFNWKRKYWFNFTPYLIQLILNIPLFTASMEKWRGFIDCFLAGNLPIRTFEKISFAVQDLHLFIYLLLAFKHIKLSRTSIGNAQFIISVSARAKWLRELAVLFSAFLITVFCLYLFVLTTGRFNPITNYFYTLVTSCLVYFIAYRLVLNPELINPDFAQKYKAYMQFEGEEGNKYLAKLTTLMNEEKVYLNPELKLATLAVKVNLPSHQLSKLINEKFEKTFNDYINEFRVEEFIMKLNDPKFQSLSIYGIALEAGFNSKSSFNAAFKKLKGKTPSEFKNS